MEILVTILVVAAAVVLLAAMPRGRGPVKEHLLAAIVGDGEGLPGAGTPAVRMTVRQDGAVVVTRTGLPDGTRTATLSATVQGLDLRLTEHPAGGLTVVDSRPGTVEAVWVMDFLTPYEHYAVRYEVEASSLQATFTLSTRPETRAGAELKI